MKILFRADASLKIGTGHVMRCLTLAKALRSRGVECHFVCRDLKGNLQEFIAANGFQVHLLPAPQASCSADTYPEHAAWAEVSWEQDAQETKVIAEEILPDWIVLDHYAFEIRWQSLVVTGNTQLAVIDDLADRQHAADILLDQNLGRRPAAYAGLVSKTCCLLAGPEFALLRPEFAAMRKDALKARNNREFHRLLISMGGIDLSDATSHVLSALAGSKLLHGVMITVVMGKFAPALSHVRDIAHDQSWSCEVLVDVSDMATLMADADVAIGAAGSASWERCCLGLPTLIAVLAENQRQAADSMCAEGAALELDPFCCASVQNGIEVMFDRTARDQMSANASAVCDGLGTQKVVEQIMAQSNEN